MESRLWAPGHWVAGTIKRKRRAWEKHCYEALKDFIGPYNAGLAMAEISTRYAEEKSVEMLKSMGVKTIGECEALNLLNAKAE